MYKYRDLLWDLLFLSLKDLNKPVELYDWYKDELGIICKISRFDRYSTEVTGRGLRFKLTKNGKQPIIPIRMTISRFLTNE